MREYIKGYHMFLPKRPVLIRPCLYLLYPVAVIWASQLIELTLVSYCIAGAMIVYAEVLMDYFTFSGIARRDGRQLSYLQTSAQGMGILRKAMIGDCLRRAGSAFVIFAGVHVQANAFPFENGSRATLIFTVTSLFMVYSLCALVTLITRFFSSFAFQVAACQLAVVVYGLLVGNVISCPEPTFWEVILFAILAVIIPVAQVMIVMRQAHLSFYDKGVREEE